jgi:hypothetical protein
MIHKLLAATTATQLDPIGGEGLGPVGAKVNSFLGTSTTGGVNALNSITSIVSSVIGFMTVAAGIWFIFMFLIGGYTWMTSLGDKHKLEEARNRIVNALIGLVIVVAGWGILALVGQFFGMDVLVTDPTTIIKNLNINK